MSGPLAGIRVLEIAAIGPVPFCATLFADLGAEVIRIERTGASGPDLPIDPRLDILGRGRRCIALDLKNPEAAEIVLQLAADADALIEGMRPGAMERLGLGPDECLARNPALVYGRMTGWGQTGPLAQRAGHDINYISMNGVLHSIGYRNEPPVPPLNLVGDYGGGAMFLATGVLAALLETRSSGKGQVIDAAMVEGSSYLLTLFHMLMAAGLWQDRRGSNLLDGGAPFYRVYETADGKHMAAGAIEAKFYRELIDGLGLDIDSLPAQMDIANWDALTVVFADAFKRRTRDEWEAIFCDRDACVTPVLSLEESIAAEHNRERGSFLDVAGVVRPNTAPRFSRTAADAGAEVTHPGEHGREILRELGYSDQQIGKLIDRRVVVEPQ